MGIIEGMDMCSYTLKVDVSMDTVLLVLHLIVASTGQLL